MTSRILGEDRPLHIVLPEDYSSDGAYPVVCPLDGGAGSTATLAGQMQAPNPDLIVVGVETVDRDRDMFPRPLEIRDNRGGGGRARRGPST